MFENYRVTKNAVTILFIHAADILKFLIKLMLKNDRVTKNTITIFSHSCRWYFKMFGKINVCENNHGN